MNLIASIQNPKIDKYLNHSKSEINYGNKKTKPYLKIEFCIFMCIQDFYLCIHSSMIIFITSLLKLT
jgi:hypothetical protein